MDFNNPKVRQAVYDHLRFAIDSVAAVLPNPREGTNASPEVITLRIMADNMRMVLISHILSFTLQADYKLKNSLVSLNEEEALPTGRKLEDLLLK